MKRIRLFKPKFYDLASRTLAIGDKCNSTREFEEFGSKLRLFFFRQ